MTLKAMASFGFGVVLSARAGWVQMEREVKPYDASRSLWGFERQAPADHPVSLTVGLKVDEDRRALLEKTFWEVSDPKHEKYGQHLSIDEITNLLAIPAAAAEIALNMKLAFFTHSERTHIRIVRASTT